jgi:very-short-patch-repair endonuclease
MERQKKGVPSPSGRGIGRGESNKLLTNARRLGNQSTDAERALWTQLRAHRFDGYKFRRQQVIGSYIVDFVCFEANLIIELDGSQHMDQVSYDNQRTEKLEQMGYRVLRFWNNEIFSELDGILETIRTALIQSPSPQPSPEGRGG